MFKIFPRFDAVDGTVPLPPPPTALGLCLGLGHVNRISLDRAGRGTARIVRVMTNICMLCFLNASAISMAAYHVWPPRYGILFGLSRWDYFIPTVNLRAGLRYRRKRLGIVAQEKGILLSLGMTCICMHLNCVCSFSSMPSAIVPGLNRVRGKKGTHKMAQKGLFSGPAIL